MGYESRIYVVNKTGSASEVNGKQMIWCEKIAMFNLCKVPIVSGQMRKYGATDGYIYADDGNAKITEDEYGEPLKEIPIQDAIRILEYAQSTEDYYRRYNPCIQLLKSFNTADWQNLVVLHYGY